MIDLKELNKTIEYLNTLKIEEEQKQLENLQVKIKNEIMETLKDTLINFHSNTMEKFLEDSNKAVCYAYDYKAIIDHLEDKINVEVWEVK